MTINHRRLATLRVAFVLMLLMAIAVPCANARADVPLTLMQGVTKLVPAARAKGLTLSPKSMTLYLGLNGQGEGATLLPLVSPEGMDGGLTFRSSKSTVASVDEKGVVTPHKVGVATITCRTTDGSKLSRTCRVTVKAIVPQSVAMSAPSVQVAPGATALLTVAVAPANAYNQAVTWKSSNPSVAKVSQTGVVTGVALGKATITCTTKSCARKATCTVNVNFANSNIYYVAIGQDVYPGANLNDLPATANDVRLFEAALRASDFGQKSMRGDVYKDLTGTQIRNVLRGLKQTYGMTDNDITYVFYSGHGAGGAQSRSGALIGVDTNVRDVAWSTSCVTVEQVRDYLDSVPGTVVLILDSCYSGQYITAKKMSASISDAATMLQAAAFGQNVIDVFSASSAQSKALTSLVQGSTNKSKYKILVACRPTEESYTAGNYSVFTGFLSEAAGIVLQGSATNPEPVQLLGDTNKNGYLSLKEAYNYTKPRAVNWCKRYGFKIQNMMVWPSNDAFPVFARIGG